jgi:hypothetical protein
MTIATCHDVFSSFTGRLVEVESRDGERFYRCRISSDFNSSSVLVPSVSTVIKGGMTKEDAASLATAKKKWDKDYEDGKKEISWDDNSSQARDRGTLIHKLIENFFLQGETSFLGEGIKDWQKYNEAIAKLYSDKNNQQLIASEFFVCNLSLLSPLGYAGRADLYVKNKRGKKTLVDVKTSGHAKSKWQWRKENGKSVKSVSYWYMNAITQISAYSLALESQGEEPDELSIWLLTPEGFMTFTLDSYDRKMARESWNGKLIKYWERDEKLLIDSDS